MIPIEPLTMIDLHPCGGTFVAVALVAPVGIIGTLFIRTLIKVRMSEHDPTQAPLQFIYEGMKSRCYSPSNHLYEYYGGRGVTFAMSG